MTEQELSLEETADLLAYFIRLASGSYRGTFEPPSAWEKLKALDLKADWSAVTWAMLQERGVIRKDLRIVDSIMSPYRWMPVAPNSLERFLPRLMREAGLTPLLTQRIEDFPDEVLESPITFIRDEVINYTREDPDARRFMESMTRLRYPPPSEE